MALIVYKNLFPRDYSDLQLNKGFVYALFHKKEDFIKKELEKKQKKIMLDPHIIIIVISGKRLKIGYQKNTPKGNV